MFKKKNKTSLSNCNKVEKELLYTNIKKNEIIEGSILPKKWQALNKTELINEAKTAIIKVSKSSNPTIKAKELGFSNVEHLIELCFNYILK